MKNITNKGINNDCQIITELFHKYADAIYENQEAQKAHFDRQPKFVQLAMGDVRCGLFIAAEALRKLTMAGVIEDEDDKETV